MTCVSIVTATPSRPQFPGQPVVLLLSIASRDEARYAHQYPLLLLNIAETECGFGLSLMEQSSYGMREQANDWTGLYMWAIAPRAHYAARRLAAIEGTRVRFPAGFFNCRGSAASACREGRQQVPRRRRRTEFAAPGRMRLR